MKFKRLCGYICGRAGKEQTDRRRLLCCYSIISNLYIISLKQWSLLCVFLIDLSISIYQTWWCYSSLKDCHQNEVSNVLCGIIIVNEWILLYYDIYLSFLFSLRNLMFHVFSFLCRIIIILFGTLVIIIKITPNNISLAYFISFHIYVCMWQQTMRALIEIDRYLFLFFSKLWRVTSRE